MENRETTIIEIAGNKLEIDLRTAKKIDTFKIGDPVKVLKKDDTYGNKIYVGVIVGFANFNSFPCIEVMVLEDSYSGTSFRFITITTEEKCQYEMLHYNQYEGMFTRNNVVQSFDREIEKKELEIAEIKRKKKYFVDEFSRAFSLIGVETNNP